MIRGDEVELWITLAVLAAEAILFVWCVRRAKQPPDPLRPRLIPYTGITIFLGLALVITVAHTVSVVTGSRLEAKMKAKGQR